MQALIGAQNDVTKQLMKKTAELKLAAESVQIPGPSDVSAAVTKDGALTSVEIDEEQYSRAVEEAVNAEKVHGIGSPEGAKGVRRSK